MLQLNYLFFFSREKINSAPLEIFYYSSATTDLTRS